MAGRDFTAERGRVVVLDSQTVSSRKPKGTPEQRREAETRVIGKLRIPRRCSSSQVHWNASIPRQSICSTPCYGLSYQFLTPLD